MEGDYLLNKIIYAMLYFYPRPHMEGDFFRGFSFVFCDISTHALTWRATFMVFFSPLLQHRFLPTPSHGGRRSLLLLRFSSSRFLPTPSHGGRRRDGREPVPKSGYFYPRPHMEGDNRAYPVV